MEEELQVNNGGESYVDQHINFYDGYVIGTYYYKILLPTCEEVYGSPENIDF